MHEAHLSHRPISVMTAVNFGELKISQDPAETLVAFSVRGWSYQFMIRF